jgi:hypothetical protein
MKRFIFSKWFGCRPRKAVPAEDWAQIIQRSADAELAVESLETRLCRLEKLVRERLALDK